MKLIKFFSFVFFSILLITKFSYAACQSEMCGHTTTNTTVVVGHVCDNDGICEASYNETPTNCPLDCHCGNGACEPNKGESISTCLFDCHCGNGSCEASKGETMTSCQVDCSCGNGICEANRGETIYNCVDCCPPDSTTTTTTSSTSTTSTTTTTSTTITTATTTSTTITTTTTTVPQFVCGDNVCNGAETFQSCPQDCHCGDGTCSAAESNLSCPQDCPCSSADRLQVAGSPEKDGCCSSNQRFLVNGVCSFCPSGQIFTQGICCPDGQSAVNGQCQNDCPLLMRLEVRQIAGEDQTTNIQDQLSTAESAFNLNCFENEKQQAMKFAKEYVKCRNHQDKLLDDGVMWYFRGGINNDGDKCANKAAQKVPFSALTNLAFVQPQSGSPYGFTAFFDQSCNPINKADLNAQESINSCANGAFLASQSFDFVTTPISLIWNEGFDIDEKVTYVNFPLDSKKDNLFWQWKASAKAPLLVYDPNHQGNITSASQLFGKWTFGGKRIASLVSNLKPQPWENGYQALQTLDQNYDGEISGQELEPLALWFDNNSNGISEPGEVKRTNEVQLKKLFLADRYQQSVTGNLSITKGYVREENGQEVTGKSVDWSTKGGLGYFSIDDVMSSLNQVTPQSNPSLPLLKNSLPDSPLNKFVGVWTWRLDSVKTSSTKDLGIIVLWPKNEKELMGYTFAEVAVTGDPKVKSVGIQNYFKATLKNNDVLVFDVDKSNGLRLNNTAMISEDGTMIKGFSTAKLNSNFPIKEIKYDWQAKKLR